MAETMADARELGRDMHNRPRSVVERALTPQRMLDRPLNQQERSVVAATAMENGLMYGGVAGVVASTLVYAAQKYSPAFRSGLGVSAKTGMVVIASAGSFFAQAQLTLARATFDPARYVQTMPETGAATGLAAHRAALGRLPVWQRAANYVYDYPARMSVGTVVPLYALIFGYESSQPATAAMPLSQRIIHTRVYGQALAIGVCIAVAMFNESMKGGGGKYVLPDIEDRRPASAEERFATMPVVAKKANDADEKYGLKGAVLVPLIYAPLLPLCIIFLRHRVQKDTLHKIVGGTVFAALAHAGTIVFNDSTVA